MCDMFSSPFVFITSFTLDLMQHTQDKAFLFQWRQLVHLIPPLLFIMSFYSWAASWKHHTTQAFDLPDYIAYTVDGVHTRAKQRLIADCVRPLERVWLEKGGCSSGGLGSVSAYTHPPNHTHTQGGWLHVVVSAFTCLRPRPPVLFGPESDLYETVSPRHRGTFLCLQAIHISPEPLRCTNPTHINMHQLPTLSYGYASLQKAFLNVLHIHEELNIQISLTSVCFVDR